MCLRVLLTDCYSGSDSEKLLERVEAIFRPQLCWHHVSEEGGVAAGKQDLPRNFFLVTISLHFLSMFFIFCQLYFRLKKNKCSGLILLALLITPASLRKGLFVDHFPIFFRFTSKTQFFKTVLSASPNFPPSLRKKKYISYFSAYGSLFCPFPRLHWFQQLFFRYFVFRTRVQSTSAVVLYIQSLIS